MAAILIIVFLIAVFLNIPTKNPNENIAGIVLNPNTNITNAPSKAFVVLAAVIAKKYTNPQGNRPFKSPKK